MQTVYAFGNHQEVQVAAFSDHIPCLASPFVGIFDKEVGSETGINLRACRYFVFAIAFPLHGHTKRIRFSDDGAVDVIFRIAAVDVAISASFA